MTATFNGCDSVMVNETKYYFLILVVIAECTQPSLGVGYEIGRALEWGKKIICLFRPASQKCMTTFDVL